MTRNHFVIAINITLLLLVGSSNGFSFTRSATTISVAREYIAATSVGQYAIFAGGWTGVVGSVEATVDIFHVPTLQRSNATLSVARFSMGAISVGNYALFGGGLDHYNGFATVDIFDASKFQWTTANLSTARSNLAVAAVNSYAIFAGGRLQNAFGVTYLDTVDIFDSSNGRWTTSKLSTKRENIAGASAGNYALFAGGSNSNGTSDVVDIFDSSTFQWTTTSLPLPLTNLVGLSFGRYAAFLGGSTNTSARIYASKLGHIFDSQTLQWTTISINGQFIGPYDCRTTMGQYALLCGYTMNETDWTKSLFFLDSTNWNTTDLNIDIRLTAAISSVGNRALVAGGNELGTIHVIPSADVDLFQFDSLDAPVQYTAPSSKTSNASRDFRLVVPLIFIFVILFSC